MIQYIDRATGERITERPPAVGFLRFIYQNPLGRWTLLPLVKRKFVSEWYGRKMDRPSSAGKIQSFVDELGIDMSESVKAVDEFSTFNEFFYRHLAPSARPIGLGLVSPGDGRLLAFDSALDIQRFYVKGQDFTLSSFLQDDDLALKYVDGPFLILRLAPNDYHRYHFPYEGILGTSLPIEGQYLSVSPIALASHFTEIFCANKRRYLELSTENNGDILLAPVGATMVGSIVDTYTPGARVQKGEEMGYFAFGGSSIVILLQKGQFTIDQDLLDNTAAGTETYVKMGEQIGR